MTSVGGKHVVRDERQNRPGLLDILKAARPGFVQREQFLLQDFTENLPRKFRAAFRQEPQSIAQLPLEACVRFSPGKVQIAEQTL